MSERDTIAAISTGPGVGAVSMIRVSGSESLDILGRMTVGVCFQERRMCYCKVYDPVSGVLLDQCVAVYFKGPRSFTGEDSVEIFGHGGRYVTSRLLEGVLAAGARLAYPGEFSQRAFLNGRIDLSQAEAVMGVISAQGERECQEALKQLSGSVSRGIGEIRDLLIEASVWIETSIDFSDEEQFDVFPRDRILGILRDVIERLRRLKRAGERAKSEGFRVVIVGEPNAGKSSLFNLLLGRERAIVTPISGTTTDLIDDVLELSGERYLLTDTAGLTQSENPIERIGVERARVAGEHADFVIWIWDSVSMTSFDDSDLLRVLFQRSSEGRLLIVLNKSDLTDEVPDSGGDFYQVQRPGLLSQFRSRYPEYADTATVTMSAKSREGLDSVESALRAMAARYRSETGDESLVSSVRHLSLIGSALESLERAVSGLESCLALEFPASDVREAVESLGSITGVIAADDVLSSIFGQFCIGK